MYTVSFATDENSFEQVGCIHSTQRLEFDYVGIIIGKALICREVKVLTDTTAVSKSDNFSGIRTCPDKIRADCLIRNTYKVLLSRGQKGCYVCCEDDELRNYIRKRIISCNEAKGKYYPQYFGEIKVFVACKPLLNLVSHFKQPVSQLFFLSKSHCCLSVILTLIVIVIIVIIFAVIEKA